MSRIIIFGAGGRAGRRAVSEALARGHRVTAVVRDPARCPELATLGADLVTGDATDADSIAALSAGHDVAISAVARMDLPSSEFYVAATEALLDGLGRALVGRMLVVGIGTLLETEPGVRVLDAPGFPSEAREFSLGHAAELEVLRGADTDVDWLMLAPPPVVLDEVAERTGEYRIGGSTVIADAAGARPFSYADLAVALIDEVERPKHSRELVAVG
ncbi:MULTISPECIES: NAD(P)-dependent oxidoreductase [Rhodococcus]|uniref:NAD(P)-dependent oxidoreductase n=1 Tax=Rhodococcus TaxID=1827 RepID=UPI001AEB03E8|nr:MULTISPECIES: NAD(P)H-binding protein [Rhodococcus]MBP1159356.1 putative NADH-flavin reductase [Rhodococcus sp. PvR099]MCZ4556821.1 NAD(P)H-binding protein [Rhodococcus maanshanensis]